MPADPDQLNDFLEALEKTGSPARIDALRETLGWDAPLYEEVKAALVAKGIMVRGRSRSTGRASKRCAPSSH